MAYRFTESFVGQAYAFRPGDVIDGPPLSAGDIGRCLERGILVELPAPEAPRAPEKKTATSRRQKSAEKAVL